MSNRPNRKPTAAARARDTRVQQARAAERSSRVPWIIAGAVLVIAVVAVVAVVATRKSDPISTAGSPGTVVSGGLSFGNVKVDGAALPGFQATSLSDPAVGQKAPILTGVTMAEAPITIGNDGRPKVIMFLAHWCPHCQAEVPVIQEWLNQNGQPDGVALYAVATGTAEDKPNFPPSKWLKKEGWTVPTMVDDAQVTAGEAYGLGGFPFFVAVGADGRVVARSSGELSIDQFKALIDQARSATTGTAPRSGAASPAPSATSAG